MRALSSNSSYYRTGSRACQAPGNSMVFTDEIFHTRFPCQGGWGPTVHITCFHVRLMVHPWICNLGALSAYMAVLSHIPEELAGNCACWNQTSDCRNKPVEMVPGRKSGEGDVEDTVTNTPGKGGDELGWGLIYISWGYGSRAVIDHMVWPWPSHLCTPSEQQPLLWLASTSCYSWH